VAAELVGAGLLTRSQHELPEHLVATKYEAIEREGSGVGLYVKPAKTIREGERIMIDYPTLLVPNQVGESMPPEIRLHLQWKAWLQLPGPARRRSRDLAKSKGRFMDELQNVVGTNAFTHEKGGVPHDVIFTEASVRDKLGS